MPKVRPVALPISYLVFTGRGAPSLSAEKYETGDKLV